MLLKIANLTQRKVVLNTQGFDRIIFLLLTYKRMRAGQSKLTYRIYWCSSYTT